MFDPETYMVCSGRVLYWQPERLDGGKPNKHQANIAPLLHVAKGATSTHRLRSSGSFNMQRHATLLLAVLCIFASCRPWWHPIQAHQVETGLAFLQPPGPISKGITPCLWLLESLGTPVSVLLPLVGTQVRSEVCSQQEDETCIASVDVQIT
jgi:hypothetical protein